MESKENQLKYSIIIPTYNERENIGLLIYLINKYLTQHKIIYEIIVVDDNSPDNTQEIVLEMQKHFGENIIKLLRRPGKLGLGTAYVDGSKLCSGDFIFIMDADFSHHRETGADIVTGTRYTHGGGVYGWNPIRKIISRGANFFATLFLNPGVSDLTGSFRLYKKEVFEDLLPSIKNGGYAFQMEIMIRAVYKNYKVEEIPITFVDRLMGKSKLGFSEIVIYFNTVLQLYTSLQI